MSTNQASIGFGKRSAFGSIALLWCLGVPAHAETLNCKPVTSLPAVISTSGVWCFTGNLITAQSSGTAVTITANNVTLDLNGWKLGGQGAGPGTNATGIYSNAFNVTVRNGIVRGFRTGIWIDGRAGVVDNTLADQNTYVGILVKGPSAIVRNNRVAETGGATITNSVYGIHANGGGSLIEHNFVTGLTEVGGQDEFGIRVFNGDHALVIDNFVTDADKGALGAGQSYGIALFGGTSDNVDQNVVSNFNNCIYYSGTGIYARNTVTSCDTNFAGGTAGDGNAP